MKIYHNPRCKKSRAGLEYLNEKGIDPEIRLYLKDPLNAEEIKMLIKKIGIEAGDLVRTQEDLYKKKLKGKIISEDEWIEVFAENPKLIRRPIVESGNKAVIGDPVDNIQPLL